MKDILVVFVVCMFLIVATAWLALNDYPFYIWMPVLLPVPFGQHWLMTRNVKLPPNRNF